MSVIHVVSAPGLSADQLEMLKKEIETGVKKDNFLLATNFEVHWETRNVASGELIRVVSYDGEGSQVSAELSNSSVIGLLFDPALVSLGVGLEGEVSEVKQGVRSLSLYVREERDRKTWVRALEAALQHLRHLAGKLGEKIEPGE